MSAGLVTSASMSLASVLAGVNPDEATSLNLLLYAMILKSLDVNNRLFFVWPFLLLL